ncbi:unnamed protein product [Adineta steineri]|uniref:Uncharacterized protein n=1 Tax=Adineta steineri TaxID=433720 RepID=A0A815P3U0_9BILA|nr:unnamed protein product [Adineta steineri]CAF4162042.1 unnamed protein product [Adineta steineri]
MNRTQQLFELIREYKHNISSKEYHIVLATHIAMVSREFSLKDEQVEENFKIQYVNKDDKLMGNHDFW